MIFKCALARYSVRRKVIKLCKMLKQHTQAPAPCIAKKAGFTARSQV